MRAGTSSGRTGHLTKVTDNRDAGKNRQYEYDALGRLKRATAGATTGSWAQRYLYDRYGNRAHVLSQQTSDWVTQLFNFVLNRAPDSGGLAAWDTVLRTGYAQGPAAFLQAAKDTAAGFFDSPEYANRNRANRDFVSDLYKAYLNREPDTGGWDQWTSALDSGASRAVVRAGFADGVEFSNRVTGLYPTASTTAAGVPRDGHSSLSFDPATNRINTPGWEYDAAGNQTRTQVAGGGWQRYEYDAANRLVTVKDDGGYTYATYTYGETNQRLIAEESGLRTYYAAEGGQVLAEYTEYGAQSAPQWAKAYVYLGGRLLSTFTPVTGGEAVEHHHPDRLGTRLVSNPANGTSFEQATLPFGNALPSESSGGTNRRFTSYDRSTATGLDYAVNRRYDPMQGRFTQVDPIEMGAVSLEHPQSLNLYTYCGNDPVNHVDPDGLFFGRLFRAIGRAFQTILKWAVIALVVAVAVTLTIAALSPAGSPGLAFAQWLWNSVLPPLISGLGTLTGTSGTSAIFGPGGTPVFNPGAGTSGSVSVFINRHNDDDQVISVSVTCPVGVTNGNCPGDGRPWHRRGIFGKIGDLVRGIAVGATTVPFTNWNFVDWVDRDRLSDEEKERLRNSRLHTAGGYVGSVGQALIPVGAGVKGFQAGKEIVLRGGRLRIAPFGNRTGHPYGRWPHYHRQRIGPNGRVRYDQGMRRHRPWEPRSTDRSWRDRF
ncbi:MAG: DUF4214 domain-containing protein [Pyrinomonadaceae bacterium]